jgi:Kef-type K+ transport system membrane component KefB
MDNNFLITLALLILIAYGFDITSPKTKIPSVLLLLLSGWIVRQATLFLHLQIPDFNALLPLIGTIGLILIILDGGLELEFNRSKIRVINKAFLWALLPMVVLIVLLAGLFMILGNNLQASLTNAVPLCVISSAIAIPGVKDFSVTNRELVIYESSFSDILGVTLFNLFALSGTLSGMTVLHFILQIAAVILVSMIATAFLSVLLSRITHKVRYVPIIFLAILIYGLCKLVHLPGLMFILIFGLFLGNFDRFRRFSWMQKLRPQVLEKEIPRFRDVVVESTFLVRTMFFLLFGFLLETREFLNPSVLPWSLLTVAVIFGLRALQLKLSRSPLLPLLFIAPRGLITILLFLSIPSGLLIPEVNRSLIIQVILLTALILMAGNMAGEQKPDHTAGEEEPGG